MTGQVKPEFYAETMQGEHFSKALVVICLEGGWVHGITS
jgi:hypothetical protein